MKKILFLLTLGLFMNVALAQSTDTNKKEVETEQKCASAEKPSNKTAKKTCEKSANKGLSLIHISEPTRPY